MAKSKPDKFNTVLFTLVLFFILFIAQDSSKVGKVVDSYLGVPVYYNGFLIDNVIGHHYSKNGYYYGLKWQCVEFVQRFYYDVLNYPMPDPKKNAKDYFDVTVPEGERNKVTGLKQFKNGGQVPPDIHDILVFQGGKYGHVALITRVEAEFVEIMQQNVSGKTVTKLKLKSDNYSYEIISDNQIAGWLRQ